MVNTDLSLPFDLVRDVAKHEFKASSGQGDLWSDLSPRSKAHWEKQARKKLWDMWSVLVRWGVRADA